MIVDSLRPLPVADELTRPFWDAAREGRLVIQRCQECGTYFHPPLPRCDICESSDLRFETVSGRGTVYSFTRLHMARLAAFADATPYAVVAVELVEQPWLLFTCNMDSTDSGALTIGAPVEAIFVDIGDGLVIPDFRIAPADVR
jgi:uncharacterized OB-fold protein